MTLVCCAPSSANRDIAFPNDEPAEARALGRLAALPDRLRDADRVLTGPARAARQTAEALGLAATVEPMLRDCAYGRWSGRTLSALETEEPAAVLEWLKDPAAAPHGGESVEAVITRTRNWLAALEDGRLLAVTHAPVIRAAIVHALGAPASSFWRIDIAPFAIVRLIGAHGRWNLTALEEMSGVEGFSMPF